MKTWESGRATEHIEDIIAGTKTYEGRLNKGKFAQYKPGDIVRLREDIYDENGKLIREVPNRATVRIKSVAEFATFTDMFNTIDYKKLLPRASSIADAISQYESFYPVVDQQQFGVLAIEVELVNHS